MATTPPPEPLITDPLLLRLQTTATTTRLHTLSLLDFLSQPPTDPSLLTSADPTTPSPYELELARYHKRLLSHFCQLRYLYRKAIMTVRQTKQETTEARQEVDELHLSLQNLEYERGHLRGEIEGCEGFEHRYRQLPLVPLEEFLSRHPEFEGRVAGEKEEDAMMMARIQDEQAQRLTLEEERLRLVKRKEELVKEMTGKKEELAKLDAAVEKWIAGQEVVKGILEARETKMKEVGMGGGT